MHQTHLEIPVSLRPLSRASDAYRPRGIPPSSLASIRVGDGQNLGLDAVMGLSRTPRTSLRVGGFVGGGGVADGRCGILVFYPGISYGRSASQE